MAAARLDSKCRTAADAVAAFQKYCQLEVNRKLASVEMLAYLFYTGDLDQLIADNGYDQILVLYSFDSFKSDPYLYRAGVAG